MRVREAYIRAFWAFHGPPPHACHYCGGELGWALAVHHVNDDPSDNRPDNLAPAHRGCHTSAHLKGQPSRMLGKRHSAATRAKMSLAQKGRALCS